MAGDVQVAEKGLEAVPGGTGGTWMVKNGDEGVESLQKARVAVSLVSPPRFLTLTENTIGSERPRTD